MLHHLMKRRALNEVYWEDENGVIYSSAFDENPKMYAPVVHARWTVYGADKQGKGGIFVCSACGKTHPHTSVYCPNCGARMDGDANA